MSECAHCNPVDNRPMTTRVNEYGKQVRVHADEADEYVLNVNRKLLALREQELRNLQNLVDRLREMVS